MNLARYIDHTNLNPAATAEDIKKLCEEAREYGFASVCVNSSRAALAASLLEGSAAVCCVVGFPLVILLQGKLGMSVAVSEA